MIILADCIGLPERAATLRGMGRDVLAVSPDHLAIPGTVPVTIPAEWLPADDRPRRKKEWWKAECLPLAAIHSLHLDADFFWIVESDVWAPVDMWRALFAAVDESPADGLFCHLQSRDHPFAATNGHWRHPAVPAWARYFQLGVMMRLSRRAASWLIEAAPEMREVFCEVSVASVVRRAGGSVEDFSKHMSYTRPRAMTGNIHGSRFDPAVFNHPVKRELGV